jgi:hypothetical protein
MIRIDQQRRWLGRLLAGTLVVALAVIGLSIVGTLATGQQQLLTNEDVARIPAGPQPIRFSHKVHAGDNQIDCQYCHIYARRTWSSGAPPVAICAGCHRFVGAQLDEVKKVMEYWDKQEPIPWVKIHDVPDFVRYPHYKHVNAKNETYPEGVPCQDCHGAIEMMDVVAKANPSFGQMGWCLSCHLTIPGTLERKRAIAAATDPRKVKNSDHPSGDYSRPLLTDCLTCHY